MARQPAASLKEQDSGIGGHGLHQFDIERRLQRGGGAWVPAFRDYNGGEERRGQFGSLRVEVEGNVRVVEVSKIYDPHHLTRAVQFLTVRTHSQISVTQVRRAITPAAGGPRAGRWRGAKSRALHRMASRKHEIVESADMQDGDR